MWPQNQMASPANCSGAVLRQSLLLWQLCSIVLSLRGRSPLLGSSSSPVTFLLPLTTDPSPYCPSPRRSGAHGTQYSYVSPLGAWLAVPSAVRLQAWKLYSGVSALGYSGLASCPWRACKCGLCFHRLLQGLWFLTTLVDLEFSGQGECFEFLSQLVKGQPVGSSSVSGVCSTVAAVSSPIDTWAAPLHSICRASQSALYLELFRVRALCRWHCPLHDHPLTIMTW